MTTLITKTTVIAVTCAFLVLVVGLILYDVISNGKKANKNKESKETEVEKE